MGSAGEDDETVRQFRVSGFVPIPHGDLFAGCGDLSHIELNECYGDVSTVMDNGNSSTTGDGIESSSGGPSDASCTKRSGRTRSA